MLKTLNSLWMMLSVLLMLFPGILFQSFASEDFISDFDIHSNHKVALTLIRHNSFCYTKCYRPEESKEDKEEDVYNTKISNSDPTVPVYSNKAIQYGGVIIGADNRQQVTYPTQNPWKVHGQLTMNFGDKIYSGSGTLVSPCHVLTAGHNLYDPKTKQWAYNVKFYPARNGLNDNIKDVNCIKKTIFPAWQYGDDNFDMGIVLLDLPIGKTMGWNGMLCVDDDYLVGLNVNVSGYPADKHPGGTMWQDESPITYINTNRKRFYYNLSAFKGQSGSSPWIKLPEASKNITLPAHSFFEYDKFSHLNGYYSLGVHAYRFLNNGLGVANVATRLTEDKMEALVSYINNS
jgi:V8-like Glu-specific endopeptidase